MATLVIKNLPDDLHARLKAQARRHHRSLTQEVAYLLEAGVGGEREGRLPASPIRLRSGYRPTVEEIEDAIAANFSLFQPDWRLQSSPEPG